MYSLCFESFICNTKKLNKMLIHFSIPTALVSGILSIYLFYPCFGDTYVRVKIISK